MHLKQNFGENSKAETSPSGIAKTAFVVTTVGTYKK